MTNEKLNILRIAEEHDSLERKSRQSMADGMLPHMWLGLPSKRARG